MCLTSHNNVPSYLHIEPIEILVFWHHCCHGNSIVLPLPHFLRTSVNIFRWGLADLVSYSCGGGAEH